MSIVCKELQQLNAHSPIFVTLFGMSIVCTERHFKNALSAITFVPSLIIYVSKFSGTSINFNPSFVYFAPYSSVIASFCSSSVILGFRSLSKLSFAFSLPCFAALSYHSTAFL